MTKKLLKYVLILFNVNFNIYYIIKIKSFIC